MKTKEFKKIGRLLKEAYAQLEKEALAEGINILSADYDALVAKTRLAVLESLGFTLEEYREAKAKVAGFSQADLVDHVEDYDTKIQEAHEASSRHVPTDEEIRAIAKEIAHAVAKEYIKPPQITNQIVERTTIKEPTVVKETVINETKVEYNDGPLLAEIGSLNERLESLKIPDPEAIKEDLKGHFDKTFKKNIDTLGMPDFRKLAMGLQAQIDEIGAGGTDVTLAGEDYLSLTNQQITANAIDLDNLSATGTPSGSTFLRGDNTWATPAGSGDVSKVGTPVNNQVGVWTGDGTIEGDTGLTFDTTDDTLTTGILNATSLTASEIVGTNADKDLVSLPVATYPSLTELSYVKGVTSAIQTQLDGKAASLGADDNYVTDAEKAALHAAVTVTDSDEIDFTLTGQDLTASLKTGSIDVLKLDAGVQTSLGLADASLQDADIGVSVQAYDADLTTWAGVTPGTGVATALAVNVGTAGAPVINGGVLGTPSSGTLTNCSGLPLSGVADSTSEALGVGSLELGHASDTTLTRVSAGVVAIEGVNVLTTAGGTLTGNVALGENTSVDLDPALSADGKYSGIAITGTAGAALAFGDLIYLAAADSRWELADADAATTADRMLGICVLAAAGDGSATKILLHGNIRADAAFPALTIGSPVYVGETAGDVQVAIPTGADNIIRRVGYALTADELYFCPSMDAQSTVA